MLKLEFEKKLEKLKLENLYRSPLALEPSDSHHFIINKKKYISFSSNDYFSLSKNNEVKKASIDAINKYGVGSGSSRYICGNNILYKKLEKKIAKINNCEDAIVFSSGYQASIGLISCLVGNQDLIVADKLIHASLIDASKLSGAKIIRFAHNNCDHARKIIQQNHQKYKKILIITESIFSMDGDAAPIESLTMLAKEFNCIFLTDHAHDLLDKNAKKIEYENHIKIATLSKCVGALGGYVAANKTIIEYIRNVARSLIYTTALPPCVLAGAMKSLEIIEKKNFAKKVLENAKYFCKLMNLKDSDSAIVVIKIGDNKKVLEIASKVMEQKFLISAIRPPTVDPKGARLRITFCYSHKKSEIKKLSQIIKLLL